MSEIRRWVCQGEGGMKRLHPLNTERFQPDPEGELVRFTDHEAAIEQVLADVKARIEDLHYGDDNLLIGTGYQLAVNDALAALTQPQTEIHINSESEPSDEDKAIVGDLVNRAVDRMKSDGGGAATAAGVADARSHTPGNDLSFTEIQRNELAMARDKFPGNAHMMVALTEEVGEVARALLEQGPGSREVLEECAQVAAVAQRIATEGDGDFTATGQQEAVADSQPTPYAKAFRERVCPVPEMPSVKYSPSKPVPWLAPEFSGIDGVADADLVRVGDFFGIPAFTHPDVKPGIVGIVSAGEVTAVIADREEPGPYAKAFRERVCPVPEFPGIEKEES